MQVLHAMSTVMQGAAWPVSITIIPQTSRTTHIIVRNMWSEDGLFQFMGTDPDSFSINPGSGKIKGGSGVVEVIVRRTTTQVDSAELLLLYRVLKSEGGPGNDGGDFWRNRDFQEEHSFPMHVPFRKKTRFALLKSLLLTSSMLLLMSICLSVVFYWPFGNKQEEQKDYLSYYTTQFKTFFGF